jgi:hypothetical protein
MRNDEGSRPVSAAGRAGTGARRCAGSFPRDDRTEPCRAIGDDSSHILVGVVPALATLELQGEGKALFQVHRLGETELVEIESRRIVGHPWTVAGWCERKTNEAT